MTNENLNKELVEALTLLVKVTNSELHVDPTTGDAVSPVMKKAHAALEKAGVYPYASKW